MSSGFTFPEEWEKEGRIGYLFGPFPPNHVISEKDNKFCSWKKLILSSSKQLDKPTFTLSELKLRFTRNGLTPTCLAKVLEQMEASHVIQKVEDWNHAPGDSWGDWAKQLTSQGLSYMWHRVVGKAEDDHVEYIICQQIKVSTGLMNQTLFLGSSAYR